MIEKKIDISVIGHFSIDSITLPKRSTPIQSLGGAVTYVSIISKRLNQKVTIISKIGKDFPEKYLNMLNSEGIDLSLIKKEKNEKTTHFEINYNKKLANRKLRLKNKMSSIDLSNFPGNLNSKIIHLAPIANEISFEIAQKLRKQNFYLLTHRDY